MISFVQVLITDGRIKQKIRCIKRLTMFIDLSNLEINRFCFETALSIGQNVSDISRKVKSK